MTKTKKELSEEISSKLGMKHTEVQQVVQEFIERMISALSKGEKIEFRNFGTFRVVERKAKVGRNPNNTKVDIKIPAKMAVKFVAGKDLAAKVAQLKIASEQVKQKAHIAAV